LKAIKEFSLYKSKLGFIISIKIILKLFLLVFSTVYCNSYLENFSPDSLRFKTATATRAFEEPIIDGKLDDAIWSSASSIIEFFQVEPLELSAPSEKTIARFLYDDESIYISFECFDSSPEKIKKPLVRRDNWFYGFGDQSDWVGISIDSKNNDYDGYFFALNAAGAKMDVSVSGHMQFDRSWDAVWNSGININENGWTAEFKIPFAVFQFENSKEIIWGIDFIRGHHRTQEVHKWPGHAKTIRGNIYQLGVLVGIKDIPNPKQLELLPFSLNGKKGGSYSYQFGLDARYGITPNSVMKATLNPDFGQVEADPSVLNLTAFETFYDEKRPFFSEGSDFFSERLELFHSRRIGKKANYLEPEEGEPKSPLGNTTILGAMKVLGSTQSGFNYGFIEAITNEERVTWLYDSTKTSVLIEPLTYYSVAKIEAPMINKLSRLGIMATDVSRRENPGATTVGLNWNLGLLDNRLFSNGQIAQSNKEGTIGNAWRFNIGYTDPSWWSARFWYGTYDDKFDINDIGYLRRNDLSWIGGRVELRKQNPWGPFLYNEVELKYMEEWRGDGLRLDKELELEQNNLLSNYWSLGVFSMLNLPSYNDDDIFRSDLAWEYKTEMWGYIGPTIKTDRRKKIIIGTDFGIGYGKKRGPGYRTSIGINVRPITQLNINIEIVQDLSPAYMQWVDVLELSEDTLRVYASSEQKTRDINLRVNWTFSPELTLECFLQPFYVNMNYNKYYNLTDPRTMNLVRYDYLFNNEDPGFLIKNTVGTMVLRWEYKQGSTIYLVYNINNSKYYSKNTSDWSNSSNNAIFVKFNYWLKI
tara:strand:+ start:1796 stop:4231 length:2436 start_codon:yes stop_codon:yes gene_type:complete